MKLLGKSTGFTLIELAMVIFIISLLVGGLLSPLSSQLEARNRRMVEVQLEEIKEALIGYAMINGRLPCATTQADPANALYGIEDPGCAFLEGYLPWKTLGVSAYDPWGVPRQNAADPWVGHWRYRVDFNFSILPPPIPVWTLGPPPTTAANGLSIIDSQGNTLTSGVEPPIAIVYSTGANQTRDGDNNNGDTVFQSGPANNVAGFDDIVFWMTRPILFNRMVAAGQLP